MLHAPEGKDWLLLPKSEFDTFAAEQKKLWNLPGIPEGIVFDSEEIEWLELWQEFEKSNLMPAVELSRFSHYHGWMQCLAHISL